MPDDFDYSAPRPRPPWGSDAPPFLTMILITLCVVLTAVYHLTPDDKANALYKITHAVLLTPEQIWNGRYLGLFTSFFVHLDILHLAFNMYWIWLLGSTLETTIPRWKYLLFIVAATMVGSCCELLISSQTGAGASGAGYALMGLLWAGRGYHESWRRLGSSQNLQAFLVWGVLCIVMTAAGTFRVANGAHFGGLLFGFAIGHLFFSPRRKPVWITALVFLAFACALSLSWMPWSSTWNWYKASQAFDRGRYQDAVAYFTRSAQEGGERHALLYNIALSWERLAFEALKADRFEDAKRYDAEFNKALEAARGAVGQTTDNEDVNRLENMKVNLDKAISSP